MRQITRAAPGRGFCGCARVTLLQLLTARAQALGVETKFQTEIAEKVFDDYADAYAKECAATN